MDERELEARIASRLHARFDGGEPSAALRVAATPVDRPAPVLRASVPRLWLPIAAVLVVTMLAGVGWRALGPGGSASSPTPDATPVGTITVVVRVPGAPSKAETTAAGDTLALRLRSIGIGNFSYGGGVNDLRFELPADVNRHLVVDMLATTGTIKITPLPAADYADVGVVAVVGEPLPVPEPALLENDDFRSGGVATASGVPTSVHMTLSPVAADAFDVYTTQNVGGTFAVLVDDKVVLTPVVNEPIHDGQIVLATNGDPESLLLLAAVVTSGPLLEAWHDPTVDVLDPSASP